MKQLEGVRKVQRIWQNAAGVLEDSFTTAFESIEDKQKNFWTSFMDSLKSAVIRIAASEAAKGIVGYIGKVTGLSEYGKKGDGTVSQQTAGQPQQGQAQSGVGTVLSLLPSLLGGKKNQAGDLAKGQSAWAAGTGALAQFFGGSAGGKGFMPGEMRVGFGMGAVQNVFIVGMDPKMLLGMPGGIGSVGQNGGGITSTLGGLFGIASMIPGVGSGIGIAGKVLGGIGGLLGFAEGGRPMPGRAAIIGERGPEIWIPDSAGTIHSNDMLNKMNSGGSPQIQVLNTGDNHFHNDMDADRVAQKSANKLDRKLRLLRG